MCPLAPTAPLAMSFGAATSRSASALPNPTPPGIGVRAELTRASPMLFFARAFASEPAALARRVWQPGRYEVRQAYLARAKPGESIAGSSAFVGADRGLVGPVGAQCGPGPGAHSPEAFGGIGGSRPGV